eukprot:TRINITY_DN2183_c0_g1_i3.p1 TRINITY_DN2183_c0_g1~~TRINITY_DN2183_c0_g1_i3.p1  ORF type:complete len:236 (-),score=71.94 TRINITY_DN2183_c0_g1_i3:170-820(-)
MADVEENKGQDLEANFNFTGKKRKAKGKGGEKKNDEAVEETKTTEKEVQSEGQGPADAVVEKDYTYEELLQRVFEQINEEKPEKPDTKLTKIKPPQVFRVGTKKTMWANFLDNCASLKRPTEHVLQYALAELGTNGNTDGQNQLVIKGRFQPKQIESVLRHYFSEYVCCRTCKSGDTLLEKENRLYFIQCQHCGSRRSVAAINKGYQAQVGKRKKE